MNTKEENPTNSVVNPNNESSQNKPEEKKELKFVSFQTHFIEKFGMAKYFREKYMTVIYGTTVEGHLYEKVILMDNDSVWRRIDNINFIPRPKQVFDCEEIIKK